MYSNEIIQAALIAYLKSSNALVAKLASAGQIKEDDYQGTVYSYPAVRVSLSNNVPLQVSGDGCPSRISFSIFVYTEDSSSKICDEIAGLVNSLFYGKSMTLSGLLFTGFKCGGLVPAQQIGGVWVSEVRYQVIL